MLVQQLLQEVGDLKDEVKLLKEEVASMKTSMKDEMESLQNGVNNQHREAMVLMEDIVSSL